MEKQSAGLVHKRLLKYIACIVTLFVVCVFPVQVNAVAVTSPKTEHIENFDTAITVHKDATVAVTETIQYVFADGDQRHGIYRDLLLKKLRLSNLSVVDQNGVPYTFTVSKAGEKTTIKIGDQNTLIEGAHTYVISYVVNGAIGYFKNFDEIYWNATGNSWPYPITHSHQTITLPVRVPQNALQIACYFGGEESNTSCADSAAVLSSATGTTVVDIAMPAGLESNQGITVAVGFPKGIVYQPTVFENFLTTLRTSIDLVVALLVFVLVTIWVVRRWWKYGRDAKGSGVIIPQYDAPEHIHPIEMAGLLNETIRDTDISAEIINLAVKGFLKIEKVENSVAFFKNEDYKFTLLKDISTTTDQFDLKLLGGMFGGAVTAGAVVSLSELTTFFLTVIELKKTVVESLIRREYFLKDPTSSRSTGMFILTGGAVAMLFISLYLANYFYDIYLIPIFVVMAVVLGIFTYLMPARTKKGVEVQECSLGFKDYLQIAEKDRINFHNAPEKKPETFEKFLPYAMVLGVEKAWAKEFEDVYLVPPAWYSDPYMGTFNTMALTNSFNNFSASTTSSFASPSSGGSGSGGGGFSGGGGGGGGGGSW